MPSRETRRSSLSTERKGKSGNVLRCGFSSAKASLTTRWVGACTRGYQHCIEQVRAQLHVSERRACAALGQHRSTQRKIPRGREDEECLTADIIELARQYGRYGYRKIAELLRRAGWTINDKRVERIWQREGLKVPHQQPKRGRLWLTNGSCIRLRPEQRNHVWSYDFVEDRTHDGRKYRMLNVLDEFTHESL